MVESLTAGGSGDDSGLVGLEDHLVSLDGNGDGGDLEGGLELGSGSLLDILVGGDGTNTGGLLVLAGSSVLGGVRVGSLLHECVSSLDVHEGVVHKTTLASVVAVLLGAVHKLLLGERFQFSVLLEVGTLNGSGGGESPA